MAPGQQWQFGPFRVDVANERLWRGTAVVVLRPKSFAVLGYLVAHAGRLVGREELLQALWSGIAVSEAVLTVCIGEIRQALEDDRQAPRYIETVPRRGYRFIGTITAAPEPGAVAGLGGLSEPAPSRQVTPDPVPLSPQPPALSPVPLVGREAEIARLEQGLEQARGGTRQIIFVAGEPGMGKTTLVDAFLARVATEAPLWLARGQCIAQYGAGEAYLPVLDALGRLCRGSGSASLLAWLGRHAPTWLVQFPALLGTAELEALQRRTLGVTRERMLRELAEAVEALTAERPLILVLEDLHWSDYATLDLVSWLAQRREPARLLVLGTYRPVDVIVRGHPLQAIKQELVRHRQCVELPLELLTAAEVAQYLAVRFGAGALPEASLQKLARAIHRRTDGQPLFMVMVVDDLVRRGWVLERDGRWEPMAGIEDLPLEVPESLQQLVEQQLEQLSPEDQRVLEVASVAGLECSAAAVAAGLAENVEAVEARCAVLARQGQFLQASGTEEWPDGTVAGRYRFRHILPQQVIYDCLPAARRIWLHRRIGERQEAGYAERAGERAAELATHFEKGREYERAVAYLRQAAENALRRHAYQEAIGHLTRGLAALTRLPGTGERVRRELDLQIALGQTLTVIHGPGAPSVVEVYRRAEQLCRQVGDIPQRIAVLRGLRRAYQGRGEPRTAHPLAEQFLSLAQQRQDPTLLGEAYMALGVSSYYLGEIATAHAHLERSLSLYDSQHRHEHVFPSGQDLGVLALTYDAMALWVLGYPDQALERARKALRLAQELSQPWTLAVALGYAAVVHGLRGDWQAVQERAGAAIDLATEHGFPPWVARGMMLRGWALAEQGRGADGLAQIRQGLAIWQAAGQELGQPFWLALVAEQYGKAAQVEEGFRLLCDALRVTDSRGVRLWEAELYRLQGELLPAGSKAQPAEAEACFRRALDVARGQGAKSFELRAAMSLSQLWQQQGKRGEGLQLLAQIYGRFTEGFDSADLRGARALLEASAGPRPDL